MYARVLRHIKPKDLRESLTLRFTEILNPTFWIGDSLKPEVREALMRFAKAFAAYVDLDDRAITDDKKLGWIEIYINGNLVVGASVVGIGVGELLNFWSFMIANRVSLYKVAKTSFAYPTLGEVNKKLVTNYLGPRLFENRLTRNVVRLAQKILP